MEELKIGVIGIGNMGSAHARAIHDGEIKNAKLCAVCDTDEKKRILAKERYPEVEVFDNHKDLLASGLADAVIIATPHYYHPPIAIDAFSAGLHVLTEKPAGVYTSAVRKMNEAAEKSGKKFCIMFNQRTNQLFAKAKEIVESGKLGTPKRFVWIVTNWYRTQFYYDSGNWRASWGGEGGGVMLNQAPHNLDLWQWIFGMPKSIRAFTSNAHYHNIEVEDECTIYAKYENGAIGTFITSTGEFPGTNRLEISGSKGKLVIESETLKFWELSEDERDFCFSAKKSFFRAPMEYSEFKPTEKETAHKGILQNFVNSILFDEPLLSPGFEGIKGLTISNAAFLSSWKNKWIDLPMNEKLFEKELKKRIKKSKLSPEFTSDVRQSEGYSERWSVKW